MPNHLIHETSPYLLQHAHNPVDWYPWGDEALKKAKAEDKPLLVSIGYAACHWCHVMERESFEDAATAAIMNNHFINIKIDREERPDLDNIYMDAVQVMTGSGGWPLNVFLTPDKKPFFGGTYFPPKKMMNRPSWQEILLGVADAFTNQRKEVEEQAHNMTEHLLQTNTFGLALNNQGGHKNTKTLDKATTNLLKTADTSWGGFGNAPKFPQTFSIQFLLRYFHTSKQDKENIGGPALRQALLSLDKMLDGGIYDQVGGGFARYATDREWLAPHFEKMLYDNALLVTVLCEAYQLTGDKKYQTSVEQTLAFVERELMHPQKGFYSALDADSEGEEGKFYTWSFEEVVKLVGEDATIFCGYYDITKEGNWEHKNILRIVTPLQDFARSKNMEVEVLEALLQKGRGQLMTAREARVRPALDDKVILGWNALMNLAYSNAFAATGKAHYKKIALDNMHFLLGAFKTENSSLLRVWKNGAAKYPAFLDDYAYLIAALLQLHHITGDTNWLEKAREYCEKVITDFTEEKGFFYYTPEGQEDVIVRKKEVYDGPTPSGNAVMAYNLLKLGLLVDNREWINRSEKMIAGMSDIMVKYPGSFGAWLQVLQQFVVGTQEIVILGSDYQNVLTETLSHYLPNAVIMAASAQREDFPLLKGKSTQKPVSIYICENYTCKKPVRSVAEMLASF